MICYHCGRPGHYANKCFDKAWGLPPVQPFPAAVHPAPSPKAAVKPDPAPARGRVNPITAEAAADAPEVILGMFLVNFSPATALSDSGASYSLVGNQFTVLHPLSMHHLHPPFAV